MFLRLSSSFIFTWCVWYGCLILTTWLCYQLLATCPIPILQNTCSLDHRLLSARSWMDMEREKYLDAFLEHVIANALKQRTCRYKLHHKLNKIKLAEYPQNLHTVFVWCRHSPVSGFRIYCGSNFHASVATIFRASSTKATSESDMKNGKLMRAKPGRSISKLECSSLRRRCVRSKRLNTNSHSQGSCHNKNHVNYCKKILQLYKKHCTYKRHEMYVVSKQEIILIWNINIHTN